MADTNPWVLNLAENPPDIYNSTLPRTLHNAMEQPYPNIFWYVNQVGNDVTHSGETEPHSPCFTNPYPYVFWYINQARNDVTHDNFYNYTPMGACYNCPNLTSITIPTSVKHIGPNMATNTNISSVTIASDCEYESTSFPVGCTVHFYNN